MESSDWIEQIIQEADLEDKYHQVLSREANTEKQLEKIRESYVAGKAGSYSKKCEGTAQQLLMTILSAIELRNIHSARYRIKTLDSLVVKYVKKKALLPKEPGTDYNIEKYRPMNKDNYYKIITDLIGIRILIRYQQQWRMVHDWICDNFMRTEKPYITNWLEDYPTGNAEDFIVEKPKLYLRNESDVTLYQNENEDIFEVYNSKEGYNSLHYLLWYDGKYVEIQVRTIYDEAWGECTHDLVYKCKAKFRKVELERLSQCLATQTQAAGMIAGLMFEKAKANEQKEEEETLVYKSMIDKKSNGSYDKLERRIQRMKVPKMEDDMFNGFIDELIINKENEG